MDARFERQDERFERRDAKLETAVDAEFDKMDTKIERMDAKFEGKLEAMSTRRFAVWLAVISSAATIAAAVLVIIFGSPHGHQPVSRVAFLARRQPGDRRSALCPFETLVTVRSRKGKIASRNRRMAEPGIVAIMRPQGSEETI